MVFFSCNDGRALSFLGRCLDERYGGSSDIAIQIDNNDVNFHSPVFLLQSVNTVGAEAYKQIGRLCDVMRLHLNHDLYIDAFIHDLDGFVIKEETQ